MQFMFSKEKIADWNVNGVKESRCMYAWMKTCQKFSKKKNLFRLAYFGGNRLCVSWMFMWQMYFVLVYFCPLSCTCVGYLFVVPSAMSAARVDMQRHHSVRFVQRWCSGKTLNYWAMMYSCVNLCFTSIVLKINLKGNCALKARTKPRRLRWNMWHPEIYMQTNTLGVCVFQVKLYL